jgi:hypothetical protein
MRSEAMVVHWHLDGVIQGSSGNGFGQHNEGFPLLK